MRVGRRSESSVSERGVRNETRGASSALSASFGSGRSATSLSYKQD